VSKLYRIYLLIVTFICLTVFNCNSQNLIVNGGFENYSACPSASGQLTLAVNWFNPASGTPDYLNACSSSLGVPTAGLGFQYANSGNAMVGIWAFCDVFSDAREYIQCQLTSPLITDSTYLFEYYVNRANWSNFAVNNISCLVSTSSTFTSGPNGLITANPQILKFNNDIIIDTLKWVKTSAIYNAIGGENCITIGNFKNDALTTYSNVPGNSSSCAAYYLIDDVSLVNITTPQWQYRDTTIYLGDSVLIGPAITGLNVDWFDMSSTFIKNDPAIYVKPTITTSYQAIESFNNVVYNHTVTVTVLSPVKATEYSKLQDNVSVFPNPTCGLIKITSKNLITNKDGFIIKICDVFGKEIINEVLKEELDISSFDKGVYTLLLFKNKQLVVTKKVMKN